MARRNRGFFFYGFWTVVLALAVLGASMVYQKPETAKEVANVTYRGTTETGGEIVETGESIINRLIKVADKAEAMEKAEAKAKEAKAKEAKAKEAKAK